MLLWIYIRQITNTAIVFQHLVLVWSRIIIYDKLMMLRMGLLIRTHQIAPHSHLLSCQSPLDLKILNSIICTSLNAKNVYVDWLIFLLWCFCVNECACVRAFFFFYNNFDGNVFVIGIDKTIVYSEGGKKKKKLSIQKEKWREDVRVTCLRNQWDSSRRWPCLCLWDMRLRITS